MKVDGATPNRWLNKGAMINQNIGVAPSTFQGVDGYFEGYMFNNYGFSCDFAKSVFVDPWDFYGSDAVVGR